MYTVIVTMNRDIARLDTRLLFAFEALAAERNVTRAAQRLGLTQRGMSGQLSRMRDLFDDPLFVRAKGGVVPTPRAQALEPSVRATLASLETLVSPSRFDPPTFDGVATIAATDYALALTRGPRRDCVTHDHVRRNAEGWFGRRRERPGRGPHRKNRV